MTSSINTNSGINVLAAREDGLFESIVAFVLLKFILVPNISCEKLAEKWFCSLRKNWETSQITSIFEVRTDHHIFTWWMSCSLRNLELCISSLFLHWNHFIGSQGFIWHLIKSTWLRLILLDLLTLHTAFSSRTSSLSISLFNLRRHVSTTLNWRVSGQIHGAILALCLNLYNCRTFVCNKSTVWPVTALEFREN